MEEKAARFVIWHDPDTDSETTEVHPYILVVPSEKNPVFMSIKNVYTTPLSVDVWADFGSVRIPPQTTPIINPNEELVFDYIFTVPDLPPGSYPTTFYIGKHNEVVYDSFTQPVIRVVEKIVEADFINFVSPKEAYQDDKKQCDFVLDVKNIIGGDIEVAHIWTIIGKDTLTNAIMEEGITIVDDRVWPLMEERLIGLPKILRLTAGEKYPISYEFRIPVDATLGDTTFCTYFGKWGEYFLLGDVFSGHSFDVDVLDVQESGFLRWIERIGEWKDIGLDDIIAIVQAYKGRRNIGFVPTFENIVNFIQFYKQYKPPRHKVRDPVIRRY